MSEERSILVGIICLWFLTTNIFELIILKNKTNKTILFIFLLFQSIQILISHVQKLIMKFIVVRKIRIHSLLWNWQI